MSDLVGNTEYRFSHDALVYSSSFQVYVDGPGDSRNKFLRISILILIYLVVWDCRIHKLVASRVGYNPGLSGVRYVTFASISHKQTQYNRVFYFQSFDVVFPKEVYF